MMFVLWSSLNHIPIQYRGPIKKTSHFIPIYFNKRNHVVIIFDVVTLLMWTSNVCTVYGKVADFREWTLKGM